ncbi:MAG: bifunctional diaminohydroxyphosphoribosylaminopyrimidine deaminase/5-amino-6-(5-phosphoribosylamino)uracil reductase RibD [Gammaproteobacteria bacterium]|nr:MAG: bifunctional diaminohydroxyphosphoribosylaminopyrimidine deaminase/5-amino-6-(5-phosphoribosylamino)uracil reductase RibD [Gammaproteobacteria bacterium]
MNKYLNDQAFMVEALQLARKGLYTTRTNPRVGCVVVKNGEIISRGYHLSPGKPHAEILALNTVRDSSDTTLYVTLEPCSHHGKTPPCAEALVAAKVARVVTAMRDPNPLVNGKGLEYLESHGIKTTTGILEADAMELNKGFVKRMTQDRPYITVKSAISLDGKTALKSGESKWISSDESRLDVQKLRARSCAIMTGIDTVLADDPSLTVRLSKEQLGIENNIQQPKRVILDTQLRISANAKTLQTSEDVIIYTCAKRNDKFAEIESNQVEIVNTERSNNNVNLQAVIIDLAKRGFNEVLVEAGSTLVGSLLKNHFVDEMIVYMAPHIMGHSSYGMAKLDFIESMQDRIEFEICQTRKVGRNLKLQLKPQYS